MKTTVELPDALIREIKLRSVNEGRKLKDVIADLLRAGLDPAPGSTVPTSSYLSHDERTGLPVIRCQHAASPGQELTPARVADILIEQEANFYREANR